MHKEFRESLYEFWKQLSLEKLQKPEYVRTVIDCHIAYDPLVTVIKATVYFYEDTVIPYYRLKPRTPKICELCEIDHTLIEAQLLFDENACNSIDVRNRMSQIRFNSSGERLL